MLHEAADVGEDVRGQLSRLDLLVETGRFVDHQQDVSIADGFIHRAQEALLEALERVGFEVLTLGPGNLYLVLPA